MVASSATMNSSGTATGATPNHRSTMQLGALVSCGLRTTFFFGVAVAISMAAGCSFDLHEVVGIDAGAGAQAEGAGAGAAGAPGSGTGGAAGGADGGAGGEAGSHADMLRCNRTMNPSFEFDVLFWAGAGAALYHEEVDDAVHGCCAARVKENGSAVGYFGLRDDPPGVFATTFPGSPYEATAWVRSASEPPNANATVKIHIHDANDMSTVLAETQANLGTKFQKLSVTVRADGRPISVSVSQYGAQPGDAFMIDLFQLVIVDECESR